jgi:uncharacterized damage-inducible protein DinB
MEPNKIYDYLTLARRRILDCVRTLSPEQYAREFPIGFGTIGKTLTHILICEWMYVRRIERLNVPPYADFPYHDETPPPFAELEVAWTKQASHTRTILNTVQDWSSTIDYAGTSDDGQPEIVTATYGDMILQLAFHEVHHRAQVMNMLRQLGIAVGDIDYNELMFHRHPAPT